MRHRPIHVVLVLCLALVLSVSLAVALGLSLASAEGQDAGAVFYVDDATCPATGSGTQGDPYCRIQDAVDTASAGDEVRVAGGTYAGAQMALDGRTGYTYTQVVFITRSLTLRGSYDAVHWDAVLDPAANPSIIDAQGYGRGISVVGRGDDLLDVTVEGFTITGGDYTGLGNPPGVGNRVCWRTGYDCGGGLLAWHTRLTLRDTVVYNNVAATSDSGRSAEGGGIALTRLQPGSLIENTTVISNSIGRGYGGGVDVGYGSDLTLRHSVVQGNSVLGSGPGDGGGVHIFQPTGLVRIEDTVFLQNRAREAGALLAKLTYGGEALQLDRVTMRGNEATSRSAALQVVKQGGGTSSARITNLLLAENRATLSADSVCVVDIVGGSTGRLDTTLAHVTAADNEVPTFLTARTSYELGTKVVLTNTLLQSFANGFLGIETGDDGDLVITHTNTLTHHVAALHMVGAGSPEFTAVNPLTGDPRLDAAYRLRAGSAAINAGVDAGVYHDIDGDPRPSGGGFDIGADEFTTYRVYLPLVSRQSP